MIPYGRHFVDENDVAEVADLLRNGSLTQGPMISEFERDICEYTGAKFAVAVSSASAALHLAAIAAGVGKDKGLITSPNTFVASANPALYLDAPLAFGDIDPNTLNLSAQSCEREIERMQQCAAIVPVHFAGLPCDMAQFQEVAKKSGAMVIEDAAHALGGLEVDGSKVGSCAHSDITVFSFHPVKAIAAGEGGILTTNDERIYRHLIRLRAHGITKLDDEFEIAQQAHGPDGQNPWYYEMQELGFHYRITDIQCVLARSQLRKLDSFIARRTSLALQYDEAFREFQNLRPAQTEGRIRSGHHIYPVRIDYDKLGISRASLMNHLKEKGIGTQVHYIPVPAHPIYRRQGFDPKDYANSWSYYQEALTLPLFFDLKDDQQGFVVETLRDIVG